MGQVKAGLSVVLPALLLLAPRAAPAQPAVASGEKFFGEDPKKPVQTGQADDYNGRWGMPPTVKPASLETAPSKPAAGTATPRSAEGFFGEDPKKPYAAGESSDFIGRWGMDTMGPKDPGRGEPEARVGEGKLPQPIVVGVPGTLRDSTAPAPAYGPQVATPWPGPKRRGAKLGERKPSGVDEADDGDLSRYSLWKGLNTPMQMPADRASQGTPDDAMAQSRADYDAKILGAQPSAGISLGSVAPLPPIAPPDSKRAFAVVEIRLASGGELRDAVARLSQSSGFSADARFEPERLSPEAEHYRVWGWMSPDDVPKALKVPNVARVEVRDSGRASPPAPTRDAASPVELVIALRVKPSEDPPTILPALVARLSAATGLVLSRVIGTEKIPESGGQAIVITARLPARNIPKLMADPDVVKVMPAPERRPGAKTPPVERRPLPARAIDFVMRHPILLLLSLLVFLPGPGLLPLRRR
ncbi:MAG: hypothetical protein HY059_09630 [Proteobacteria bacterium]|nr:hypothetical protein [Pseudomonadota bacterium]